MLIKTSKEWQNSIPQIVVMDPDGWDRTNYQYSWHEEKITKTEYFNRVMKSTVRTGLEGKKIIDKFIKENLI